MGIVKRILVKYFSLDPEYCSSCDTLREQLNIANHEKRQMLETILSFTKPIVEEKPLETTVIAPILPKATTWAIRRAELERNDRETAAKMEAVKKMNEELEKELKIEEKEQNAS